MTQAKIIYTLTDEAPALATHSLLPIVSSFAKAAGVSVETSDISLAGRILSAFPECLSDKQQVEDGLKSLGELTLKPEANIIKLPNISASLPQLKAAIKELQEQGYGLPNYPDEPSTPAEKDAHSRYEKLLGSAVNPVLRQGNSDRRAPNAVKEYARKFPHSMGAWRKASRSHADYMRGGDFFSSEQSVTLEEACNVRLEFVGKDGKVEVKKELPIEKGEVLDSMFMSARQLRNFFERTLQECKDDDVMWSLHIKATMMKISHPIVFGHAVKVFFKDLFDEYGELFEEIGVNANDGMSSVYDRIKTLPASKQEEIEELIHACYEKRPEIAMVDSVKGITNLHIPSDVIVDASMPSMIRNSGQMWGRDGKLKDVKAVMPESTYARIYQEMIHFCRTNGAFDPTTMGSVPNVGLMAMKAEEYGSHDKTFEMQADGIMRVVRAEDGEVLMQHEVEKGDIWRACQTKDAAIRDWVKLAINRTRESIKTKPDTAAIFWLDAERAHDMELRQKVFKYLEEFGQDGLDIRVMGYNRAMRNSIERMVRGKDTISVTGNVLRDYLTDLFPIMELGTSAKMLSIVPMLAGGGMYETGAGGSAPKHVQQVVEENHLRWDSLGEFLALAVSFEELGQKSNIKAATLLGNALDKATGTLLENNKSPSRRTGELDNRGSHFYLAMYWAEELAKQTEDADLAAKFAPLAKELKAKEAKIVEELNSVQGQPADLGGYYNPDLDKVTAIMRPSSTLNKAIDSLNA